MNSANKAANPGNKTMNSSNKISLTIVACSILVSLVILMASFLQIKLASPTTPLPTAQSVLQPTPAPTAQTAFIQWEYINLDYSQHKTYDADVPLYEVLIIDEPYESALYRILGKGCSVYSYPDILFNPETQKCAGKNFKGREYFFNVLGQDGWELISIENTSDQYNYSVDAVFKRPIR